MMDTDVWPQNQIFLTFFLVDNAIEFVQSVDFKKNILLTV